MKPSPAFASVLYFIAGPGIVAGLIPWMITGWNVPTDNLFVLGLSFGLGGVVIGGGLILLIECLVRFAGEGRGSPMPWLPTESLVTTGPYRVVRNPMYLGIVITIVGQAIVFLNWPLLVWAAGVWMAFHFLVVRGEEPGLRQNYPEYDNYASEVTRWIPRFPFLPP